MRPRTVSSPRARRSATAGSAVVTPRGGIRSGADIRVLPGRAAGCTAGTAAGFYVDDVEGALGERPGLGASEPDPQHRGPVLLVLQEPFLGLGEVLLGLGVELHEGLRLDDHALFLAVPGEGHGADPELLLDGCLEGSGVGVLGGRHRGYRGAAAATAYDLVQQLVHALGERCDLGLLQGHAGHAGAAWVAWRKKVRRPGSPTVPATKRSGGS